MRITLRDYQLNAIKSLKTGCILNGGVGSGKSITSLGYYYLLNGGSLMTLEGGKYVKMKSPKDLYIITTAMKRDKHEWDQELMPFRLFVHKENRIYNHELVIDSWQNIKKYQDIENAFFIFDEDHVTGSGAWVKAFKKIAKKNDWIILSATPGDQWSDYIPIFVANGFYKNKTDFVRQHVIYAPYVPYPMIDRYINTGRLIRLRRKILIDMDYHKKTIPHHLYFYMDYDLEDYRNVMKNRWDIWNQKPIESSSELCYALRKVVNSDETRSVKILELLDTCQKAIIFYNFDYELEILKNIGYSDDTVVAEWNGHKHQPIPKTEKWVYLVQYNAGCEGWNSIDTDTIIFYSQNYSYKTMVQSCGRIDRLNTPFTDLYYYHLTSRSGIDRAIFKALTEKKNFNENRFVTYSR